MYISSRSWHARVFRWWQRMKYGELWRAPSGVNLCPYVRAVLFWSWSRWLMRSGKFRLGKFIVRIPYLFWGLQPLWVLWAVNAIFGHKVFMNVLQVLGIIVAILSLISVLGLIVWAIIWTFKRQAVVDAVDSAASFASVLKERVQAGHHKICPVVEFRDESSRSDGVL